MGWSLDADFLGQRGDGKAGPEGIDARVEASEFLSLFMEASQPETPQTTTGTPPYGEMPALLLRSKP